LINKTIETIGPLDAAAMEKCQARLDNLTKPLGSLHALEQLTVKLAGITGKARPSELKPSIILMAADHGVTDEGVSAYPKEVTPQMVVNFCRGGAAINVFAKHVGAELVLVDIGVACDLADLPGLRREKICYGTANIAKGPAMSREQAINAISVGIKVANEQLEKGINVIGLGEMGIGNTTPSSAVVACYSSKTVSELTGRGTGIADAAFANKIRVIEQALAVNKPLIDDPLDVLAKVGGLEIAGLVGVILAAAAGRAMVVVDGLITAAAALIAVKMAPKLGSYLIGSHLSCEPAHKEALSLIGIPAYLQLEMRLGEGTGAALGISLVDAGLHVLNDMKTFAEAQVAVAQDGPGVLKQRVDFT
jgi:nicotinate-nucleotide--dimethylbenzimidazole phosphoribosyltransferase